MEKKAVMSPTGQKKSMAQIYGFSVPPIWH